MPQQPLAGGSAGYSCTDIDTDARLRIGSACGLHVKNRLPAGMSPEWARLILVRALGLFQEMSGLDPHLIMMTFTTREKKLLFPLIDIDAELKLHGPNGVSKPKTK